MSQGLEQVSQNKSTRGVRRSACELPPSNMSSAAASSSSLAPALLCRELRLEEGGRPLYLPGMGEAQGEGNDRGSTASTTPMLSETGGEGSWQRPDGRRLRWWYWWWWCRGHGEEARALQRHAGAVRVWVERPQPDKPEHSRAAAPAPGEGARTARPGEGGRNGQMDERRGLGAGDSRSPPKHNGPRTGPSG